jgi:hypothetical protein
MSQSSSDSYSRDVYPESGKPLEAQLERYQDLDKIEDRVEDSKSYWKGNGGKFRGDAVHALITAGGDSGSKEERKSLAKFLEPFRPLKLFGVDRGSPGSQDRPKRAVLLGKFGREFPVVAVLQPKWESDKKDKSKDGVLRDGNVKSSDLLVSGMYLTRTKGIKPVHPVIYEFDYYPEHDLNEEQKGRNEEITESGINLVSVVGEKHKEINVGQFADNFSDIVETQIEFKRSEIGSAEFLGKVSPPTRSEDTVPFVDSRIALNPKKFRDRARSYCSNLKKGKSKEIEKKMRINVKRYGISIEEVFPAEGETISSLVDT